MAESHESREFEALMELGIREMNRRSFLARLRKTGFFVVGSGAIGSLLAACGDDAAVTTTTAPPPPASTTAGPAASTSTTGAPTATEASTTSAPGTVATTAATTTQPPAPPEPLVFAMSGPAQGVNSDGAGTNDFPSFIAWYACYDNLCDFKLPSNVDDLKAVMQAGYQPVPQLAESWDVSADGTTYTFHLRQGVMSHFGNEMTSEDVLFSIEKPLTAGATNGFILGFIGGGLTSIDQVTAVDDYTVEIALPAPSTRLPLALGWGRIVIYDSTEVKAHATDDDPFANEWLNQNVAGFGPYALTSFGSAGRELILEARDDYWGDPPDIKTVIQRGVEEAGNRLQLLITEDIHYAQNLDPLQLDEVDSYDHLATTRVADNAFAMMGITYEPPWGSNDVRGAIAKAIPYDAIVSQIYRGRAQRQRSILLPFAEGYTEEFWQYDTDMDAATTVLSGVGETLTISYSEGFPVHEQLAIAIQGALRQAGLDIELQKLVSQDFNPQFLSGGLQAYVSDRLFPALPDPDFFMAIYGGTSGGFLNAYKYANADVDAAINTITTDPAGRAAAIKEGQRHLVRDLLFIPLAYLGTVHAHNASIEIPYIRTGNGYPLWQEVNIVG